MNLLVHAPKSKSTLDVCDHNVSRPLVLGAEDMPLNALSKTAMLADAVARCDQSSSLHEMTSNHIYKTAAAVSVTSLHSLTSTATSTSTRLSRQHRSSFGYSIGMQSAFKLLLILNLKSSLNTYTYWKGSKTRLNCLSSTTRSSPTGYPMSMKYSPICTG